MQYVKMDVQYLNYEPKLIFVIILLLKVKKIINLSLKLIAFLIYFQFSLLHLNQIS